MYHIPKRTITYGNLAMTTPFIYMFSIGLFGMLTLAKSPGNQQVTPPGPALAVLIATVIVVWLFLTRLFVDKHIKNRTLLLQQQASNLRLAGTNKDTIHPSAVFESSAASNTIKVAYFNTIATPAIRYYEAKKTIMHSRNTYDTYYSIIEIDLAKKLPEITIVSKMAKLTIFNTIYDKEQINTMDSGFSDKYTVYFPSGYQIDGRSIISPDIMSVILDMPQYDVEIVGDKAYLYRRLINPAELVAVFDDAKTFRATLCDHAVYYRDERTKSGAVSKKATLQTTKIAIFSMLACILMPTVLGIAQPYIASLPFIQQQIASFLLIGLALLMSSIIYAIILQILNRRKEHSS